MKILIQALLLFVPCVGALCPDGTSIQPCTCQNENKEDTVICRSIKLSQLTTTLRQSFCGHTIHKFYLVLPDIEYLPSNLFVKNIVYDIQIDSANISHFTEAGRSAFYGQEPYLKSLSMRRCNLKDELRWDMIAELRALTYLDLSYNQLQRVPKQWFNRSPPNLRSLILKENEITHLNAGSFRYMHKLNELDLSGNKISVLRRDIFPHPGNELIFLRLSDNNLRSLPEDLFDEMLGLRRIYLDNNKLDTLSKDVWSPIWGDLDRLELYGNPIECNSSIDWITELQPPKLLYATCTLSNNVDFSYKFVKELGNLK